MSQTMSFRPVSTDPFEYYFYKRAQVAEELADSGAVVDAYILTTASLDALAAIWLSDFPNDQKDMKKEQGGSIPASIRLTRFLKKFAPNDPHVKKVAVICFAQDWKEHRQKDNHIAELLLSRRMYRGNQESGKWLLPRNLDVSREELTQECPQIKNPSNLFNLLENYEYGAILYSFYRCPFVHHATNSNRTHGFANRNEIMYYHPTENNKVPIGFGLNIITNWLRQAVSGYVQTCHAKNIVPAQNINAGFEQENRFQKLWNKLD
jgi:hypothetical protein